MRSIVGAVVLVSLGVAASADDVVLKTGRTLTGTIVTEDDAKVMLRSHGGTMSIARDQIQEIRRGPAPAETAPPPAPPPGAKKPERAKETAPTKQQAEAPKPSGKRTARDVLAELETIRLTPWESEETTRATDAGMKNYKVIGTDGRATMRDDRPTSPDGIAALYHLQDSWDGHTVTWLNGEKLFYWFRLYWHDDTRSWTTVSTELEAFQRDCAWARRIADMCCKDVNGLVAAAIDEQEIEHALGTDRSAPATKERAKLRQDCALATGSSNAGELLAQVREIDAELVFAKKSTDKISLAMKRRDVLRRLVDALGL